MRIVIAGQKAFGAEVLSLCLARGHDVAAACSPALAGDGRRPDRLLDRARAAGVPWLPAGTLRAATMPAGVDLIIAAHSHDYLGRPTRAAAKLGAIGYHPSLLPLHRGRDAVRWAIRLRERTTGGTVYWLNDEVDGGDIAAQAHVLIRPADTAADLWQRELMPLGLALFGRVLGDLEAGRVVRVRQDPALATWEPRLDGAPIPRPELPQLGTVDGYQVVAGTAGRLLAAGLGA